MDVLTRMHLGTFDTRVFVIADGPDVKFLKALDETGPALKRVSLSGCTGVGDAACSQLVDAFLKVSFASHRDRALFETAFGAPVG